MASDSRIGEFVQSNSNSNININKPKPNKFGDVQGLTAYDLTFITKDHLALESKAILDLPWQTLTAVQVSYKEQKNKRNGQ